MFCFFAPIPFFFAIVRDLGRKINKLLCMEHCWEQAWNFPQSLGTLVRSFGSEIGHRNVAHIACSMFLLPNRACVAWKIIWLEFLKCTPRTESQHSQGS